MSRTANDLLINEYPLQVLPSLAVLIGLNEAIVLQQIHYWLGKSKNARNDRKWVYKTYPEWNEEFPFWSEVTIGRIVRKLESLELLISSSTFNAISTDRTKWYTIDYEVLDSLRNYQVDTLDRINLRFSRSYQSDTILPETTPETTDQTAIASQETLNQVIKAYQQHIDLVIPPIMLDKIKAAVEAHNTAWIVEALEITALRSTEGKLRGRPNWNYAMSIVSSWEREGKDIQQSSGPTIGDTEAWLHFDL